MSRSLGMAAAVIMIAFAATGVAQARAKYNDNNARPGYAGQVYSSTPVARFVPGRGIVGESCDMPSSVCSNDERIND
jgi:hypothetical protein